MNRDEGLHFGLLLFCECIDQVIKALLTHIKSSYADPYMLSLTISSIG